MNGEQVLKSVAEKLSVPYLKLWALIDFESGWNPKAINPITGAAGLIQFTRSTAQKLGFTDQYDLIRKNPTIEQQLQKPVYNYLKAYTPFFGDQSLYMSVFYPVARTWPVMRLFPPSVRKANPGINTPYDYIRKINSRLGLTSVTPLLYVLVVCVAGYGIFKLYKKGVRNDKAKTTSTRQG